MFAAINRQVATVIRAKQLPMNAAQEIALGHDTGTNSAHLPLSGPRVLEQNIFSISSGVDMFA